MRAACLAVLVLIAAAWAAPSATAEPARAESLSEHSAYAQLRPAAKRPGLRPRPGMNRPGIAARPPGFNRPAVGGRPPVAVVRPDGSSVIIRPRPPGVRPPIARPPQWRPWRPGLRFAIAAGVASATVAAQLGWCHVHRYPAGGMRFHGDVRCHRHRDWANPSIAYVRAW